MQKRYYEWSPGIAYCVGLIASDGSLSKDGRHIDLTSVDYEQLENFCEGMGRALPISSKSKARKANEQPAYRVQFSDVAFYDFLLLVGLTPNKSKTMTRLNVPSRCYVHFLRGVFDGDGSYYGYYDKRWRSSFMFYLTITSASRPFLEFIREKNVQHLKTGIGALNIANGAYILSYAKRDTIIIAENMYRDASRLFLTRKRAKLEGFIREAKNAIITPDARVVKLADT
ncbi:hypothetical protein GW930_01945 [Candidatus Saccharibacteria bacterium]|nr:hypothetical protein [Candidatus Saccharibacteria bacterium]